MERINASIDFDKRLFAQDIAGSKAHCEMLRAQGIITESDAHAIIAGLDAVLTEIKGGAFAFNRALEDIHMNVEHRLGQLHAQPARADPAPPHTRQPQHSTQRVVLLAEAAPAQLTDAAW